MVELEKGMKFTKGLCDENNIIVDSYVPRKCAFTNKILHSKDRSSVQMSFVEVNENGEATGKKSVVALSGYIRAKGRADMAIFISKMRVA